MSVRQRAARMNAPRTTTTTGARTSVQHRNRKTKPVHCRAPSVGQESLNAVHLTWWPICSQSAANAVTPLFSACKILHSDVARRASCPLVIDLAPPPSPVKPNTNPQEKKRKAHFVQRCCAPARTLTRASPSNEELRMVIAGGSRRSWTQKRPPFVGSRQRHSRASLRVE